jgi:hypothetical protein
MVVSDFIPSGLRLILPSRFTLEYFYIVLVNYTEIFSSLFALSRFSFALSVIIFR